MNTSGLSRLLPNIGDATSRCIDWSCDLRVGGEVVAGSCIQKVSPVFGNYENYQKLTRFWRKRDTWDMN
jgi:hypothetical protein